MSGPSRPTFPDSGASTGSDSPDAFALLTGHAGLPIGHISFRHDAEIFGEGEPADHIYQVMTGAVRCHKLLEDGRRQIAAFCLPGDVFGVDIDGTYHFTAEAIISTTVRFARRPEVDGSGEQRAQVIRDALDLIARSLDHAENHIVLLGRKSALERVATFLLEMDGRLHAAGVLELPMRRRDIADYLGLTVETVSRSLTILRRDGMLKFTGQARRRIGLSDLRRLRALDI